MFSGDRVYMSEAASLATQNNHLPCKQTLYPVVVGTSVLGIKFKDGVLVAADTVGSYGSMAKYWSLSRIMTVNDSTIMGCGGDYADFQFIQNIIEQKVIEEECIADGFTYKPKALFSWLTRVMYNRRSKMNPLWNTVIVAGMQNDEPFLGYVDKIGVAYEANSVASGYGAYIAQPLMRDALSRKPDMSEAEARAVLDQCMSVLYYRDARSWNKYEIAVVTSKGSHVDLRTASTNWNIASMVTGYE